MSTYPLKTTIIGTLTPALEKQWEILWKESREATFVNSPQWFRSSVEAFGYTDYVLITIYRGEKLVALAPLIKDAFYGLSVYGLPPGNFSCGMPFLVDLTEKKAVKALVTAMLSMGCIVFENVPELVVLALQECTKNMICSGTSPNFSYGIQKDKDGQVLFAPKAKFLYRVRKQEQEFTLKDFDGTKPESLDTIFDLDLHSRKQERGYNAFADEKIRQLYRSLATHFGTDLKLSVLYYKDTAIAYAIGFQVKQTYIGSQLAFDGAYKAFAPGKVLIAKLIESLGQSGISVVNFGSGDSPIKRAMTSDFVPLFTVVLTNHALTRTYLQWVQISKTKAFHFMQTHPSLYTNYKSIQRVIASFL